MEKRTGTSLDTDLDPFFQSVRGKEGKAAQVRRLAGQKSGRVGGRRLEIERNHGGRWFGVEISFYGRVTNLRTRHCRVPGDGRTMRVRDTMLHSGI